MAQQGKELASVNTIGRFFVKHKAQISAALPQHINPDRMIRLALTSFSQNPKLAQCSAESLFASVIVASQLGLEIGIDGQAFLVPYKGIATCIPGWKGYVDLVTRSGRGTVWTGAVHECDEFDYRLGDAPFISHKPGDAYDDAPITHVYAVGRVKGSDWPNLEVWTLNKVLKHRDKYNKVGKNHYSFANEEMYARKIPLMQVLKYMPKSVELSQAMDIDLAATEGKSAQFIDGEFHIFGERENGAGHDLNSMIQNDALAKQSVQTEKAKVKPEPEQEPAKKKPADKKTEPEPENIESAQEASQDDLSDISME